MRMRGNNCESQRRWEGRWLFVVGHTNEGSAASLWPLHQPLTKPPASSERSGAEKAPAAKLEARGVWNMGNNESGCGGETANEV